MDVKAFAPEAAMDDTPMRDEDLLTEMVMAVVDRPEKVRVESVQGGPKSVSLIVHTDPADYGRVVGKNGRTVEAIRSFMNVVASRQGKRINISMGDEQNRSFKRPCRQRPSDVRVERINRHG